MSEAARREARRWTSRPMQMTILAALVGVGLTIATPTPAHAEGCGGFDSWAGGGGYCDYDYQPDGSYMHCVHVIVLGFRDQQCNRIYPPAP